MEGLLEVLSNCELVDPFLLFNFKVLLLLLLHNAVPDDLEIILGVLSFFSLPFDFSIVVFFLERNMLTYLAYENST
jgi:hypothetical protein